jgi:pimeloyl-ACP methyl ester carboxylesterase
MRSDQRVISSDGTPITFDVQGRGPALILVTGGLDDGSENTPLARELSQRFEVFNYARRGRAPSGDTLPYAVAREIEDIEALMDRAGGHAHLYGLSSGGALVLEAALAGISADRLAVYEVPFDLASETAARQREYVAKLEDLLARGERGRALELFMRLAGSSEEMIDAARRSAFWSQLEALAHTLAYDAACLGDRIPHPERLARVRQPTLVATGGSIEPFERAADAMADSIPRAERCILRGQAHQVDPEVLAPLLARFFNA